MDNIPRGYQLLITTSENDSDNHQTQVLSGLTLYDVEFYVDLMRSFKSPHECLGYRFTPLDTKFGGHPVPDDILEKIFTDCFDRHPYVSEEIKELFPLDDLEALHDNLVDNVLSSPDEFYYEYENFCRCFERLKVYYFPDEIKNVTEQFINKQSNNEAD